MTESNPLPIFDGHNDVLMNYFPPQQGKIADFFSGDDNIRIDMPRARKGGFAGGFFAVFVPEQDSDEIEILSKHFGPGAEYVPAGIEFDYALRGAMSMTAALFRLEAASNGQLKVVRTADELAACIADGVMAAILHLEGAEPIDTDLNALEIFYQAGLRSLGLVWSRPTAFAYGVPFKFPHSPDTGPGLTDAGKALVRACNQLNIMVDLSHLNEKGFWDVAEISDAPLVATHSNAHALCPLTRNLTDKQLDAIKETDGMVGLNFVPNFLREDGKGDSNIPMETLVRHLDYLVERVGINRVGIGADFGLNAFEVPQVIGDVSGLPKLVDALRDAGYDDEALRKIGYENWLRVLRQTWKST